MKSKWILVPFIISLSGCAASLNDQRQLFENEPVKTQSGKLLSVHDLKVDYKNQTGTDIPPVNTLSCGWDGDCYFSKWSEAYSAGLEKVREKERIKQEKANKKCIENPECYRRQLIAEESTNLNNVYIFALASNQYQQSDYDALVRKVCRFSGQEQRRGMNFDNFLNRIKLAEGFSPADRDITTRVAVACWKLSSSGVSDGTTQLHSLY